MKKLIFILLLCAFAWADGANLLAVGKKVPDFQLTTEDNKPVKLSDFKGKVVLVTFLYTQCPYPDKCPMLAEKLGKTRDLVDSLEGGKDKFHVLSITIDPKRDTATALNKYASSTNRDAANWTFLTGTPGEVQKVASLFGVIYWDEKGVVEHNMRTAVIDQSGKLYKLWTGNDWKPGEMSAVVRDLLTQ